MPRVVAVATAARLATGKEVPKRAFANVLLPEACGPVRAITRKGSGEIGRSGSQSCGSVSSESGERIGTGGAAMAALFGIVIEVQGCGWVVGRCCGC